MSDPAPEQKKRIHELVKFSHKRSGLFRVVHADGAWGGANQAGIIHLTFYSEHPTIPTSVTYPVDENGMMADAAKSENEEGWEREMEVSIAMTIPAAYQLRATIDNFIKIAVEQLQQLKQKTESAAKQSDVKIE